MRIDQDRCVGCGQCVLYCPVNAITLIKRKGDTNSKARSNDVGQIDLEECVECTNCLRFACCPTDALYQQQLVWPRMVRSILSGTQNRGEEIDTPRGRREGMKTNDVTGRFKRGFAGVTFEFGRPVLGARLRDVEKAACAIAKIGVEFEQLNPVTRLMEDPRTGKFKEDVLNEKVMSAFLEFTIRLDNLPELFDCMRKVFREIETVLSINMITRVNSDGSIPTESFLKDAGLWTAPNGKTCVGLGRPLTKKN